MIVLVLTGSIGMGKSTTARLFAEAGAAVWDADAAVHALYARGGAAVGPVEAAFPGTTVDGAVDRTRLAASLQDDPEAFARLEAIVHPLVRADREAFIARAEADARPVVVLDIPLWFETGADRTGVTAVVVASAPAEEQRRRVLARPGMTEARFQQILARQTPDAEKRAGADVVIDTGHGLDHARKQVELLMARYTAPAAD
ncbi:dephospho-CoA kinase [Brevundimonas sp. A19_0]|uniref:dephospho-CoA kinase n=1 Tax=Brevundimonas sp. A19_0 TaxID=2821087 RepID=UPI001ADB80D6|nr:dephospho-CoA kinase [Brevundimonas sp. A19_0]MBO9501243.1 dephospho-CoA kinase [Brevundimonas sp. A19_0]